MFAVAHVHLRKFSVTRLLSKLVFTHLVFVDYTTDVYVAIAGALNSLLVLVYILHLSLYIFLVNVRRHSQIVQPFHKLSIFCINALCLLLLYNKVEGSLLFQRL